MRPGIIWFGDNAGVRGSLRTRLHSLGLVQLAHVDLLQTQGEICKGKRAIYVPHICIGDEK